MSDRKERGFWSNPDKIKEGVEEFIKCYGIENFNFNFLTKNKFHSLCVGLQRHSQLLYEKYPNLPKPQITTKPKNYYKNIENVKREFIYLVEKYGCFPQHSREILKEEKLNTLRNIIEDYGGVAEMYKLCNIEPPITISSLESCCKTILDEFIKDSAFIDNGRKKLDLYGINLQNKETKQWFQIDRFYIKERVAIEIQGKQHYSAGGKKTAWTQKRVDRVKEIDEIKKNILNKSNVYLIEIPYTRASKKFIFDALVASGKFKLDNTSC
jgi:hypothetical protein